VVELLATTDPVRLSYLRAVLNDAGIETFAFDTAMPVPSAFPVRLMVQDEDEAAARRILAVHDEG
jgi:hypothetical protein